jgi:hypothetical protein
MSQSYTVIAMVVMAAQVKCVRRCSKLALAHRKLVHSLFPTLASEPLDGCAGGLYVGVSHVHIQSASPPNQKVFARSQFAIDD